MSTAASQARVAAVVSSALKPCWTAVKQCDCTVVLTLQCLLWNWYIVLNVQCVCCNFLQESQVILQQILQSCYDSTRKASYYHKFPYRNFRKYSARKAFCKTNSEGSVSTLVNVENRNNEKFGRNLINWISSSTSFQTKHEEDKIRMREI